MNPLWHPSWWVLYVSSRGWWILGSRKSRTLLLVIHLLLVVWMWDGILLPNAWFCVSVMLTSQHSLYAFDAWHVQFVQDGAVPNFVKFFTASMNRRNSGWIMSLASAMISVRIKAALDVDTTLVQPCCSWLWCRINMPSNLKRITLSISFEMVLVKVIFVAISYDFSVPHWGCRKHVYCPRELSSGFHTFAIIQKSYRRIIILFILLYKS